MIECTEVYPYGMTVEWIIRDKFMPLPPHRTIGEAIVGRLPDVETWQVSVIQPGLVKFRFPDAATRARAKDALLDVENSLDLWRVTFQNPPYA